jgi:hypothetical protein
VFAAQPNGWAMVDSAKGKEKQQQKEKKEKKSLWI